jgi:hypothetical protein
VGGTADPAPGGGDALIPPQECPAGQVWNGVAGECVLLGATSDGAGSEDGGCHGGAGGGLLMGLGGVLAALLRRTAGPSSGSAPGSSGRRAA